MLIFSGWIPDDTKLPVRGNPNLKSTMGLAMLASIIIAILTNLYVMVRVIVLEFKAKWRTKQSIKMRQRR